MRLRLRKAVALTTKKAVIPTAFFVNKPIIITFLAMEKVIFLYHYNAAVDRWFIEDKYFFNYFLSLFCGFAVNVRISPIF